MVTASRSLSARHDQMARSGTISPVQWEACRRYLALAEATRGGMPCALGSLGSSARSGIEGQVHAKLSLQAAHAALGPSAQALCDALILENLAVRTIAERCGVRAENAMGQIQAALTRLVEHWKLL